MSLSFGYSMVTQLVDSVVDSGFIGDWWIKVDKLRELYNTNFLNPTIQRNAIPITWTHKAWRHAPWLVLANRPLSSPADSKHAAQRQRRHDASEMRTQEFASDVIKKTNYLNHPILNTPNFSDPEETCKFTRGTKEQPQGTRSKL